MAPDIFDNLIKSLALLAPPKMHERVQWDVSFVALFSAMFPCMLH